MDFDATIEKTRRDLLELTARKRGLQEEAGVSLGRFGVERIIVEVCIDVSVRNRFHIGFAARIKESDQLLAIAFVTVAATGCPAPLTSSDVRGLIRTGTFKVKRYY